MQPLRINTIPTNTPHEAAAQEPIQQQPIGRMQVLPVALELLGSGAPVQEPPSESGRGAIRGIRHLMPEQGEEENLTSSIARLVLGPNSEPPQPTSDEQNVSPNGLFGMMPQSLLLGFIEPFSPQSLALLAQTNHTMRDAVRDYRIQQTARIKNEPGLEDLLTSFCPQSLSAKNFNSITNTLFTIVVPNVLASLKSSPYVSDEEKRELLAHSPEAIVNSPSLLKTVLQAAYNMDLVFLVATIRDQSPPSVLRVASSLGERASVSRDWLTSNGASVTEIQHRYTNKNGYTVTCLPKEICALQNLREIDLFNNRLTALPPEIGELQNLEKLFLFGNRLIALPPKIGRLQKLETLFLFGNRLTALPPEIGRLQNLGWLELGNNLLTALPPEIGGLQKLTLLYLSGNQLITLPPEIVRLQNLERLELGNNLLTALPPEISGLQNLGWLNLFNNRLTALPSEIGGLQNLTKLFLDESLRSSVPESLQSRHDLQIIYTRLK